MSDFTVKDGFMWGELREGINRSTNVEGSIHNDAVAQKIGMRGGTVAGTIHLDLFAPIIQKTFGKSWFEKGTLSMFYTYATLNKEQVRAVVAEPGGKTDDVLLEARVEMADGRVSESGTLSIGNPDASPYLQTIEFKNAQPEELRILSDIRVGDETGPKEVMATEAAEKESLPYCEDTIDWYSGESPWGEPIVPLSHLWGLMHVSDNRSFQGVGFFGATEFRMVNGPVKIGVPYRATNKVICVGAGKKSEFFWVDGSLYEKDSDTLVATMRHLNRWMKAGSPLYPE